MEEVLKFFYVLATVATVCVGAFMILSYYESYSWSYYGGGRTTKESLFVYGLLTIIGGPISLRLAYEVFMMFILLVKNTIEINNKLVAPSTPAPQEEAAPAEKVVPTNVCPKCGNTHKEGAAFCPFCGQQL